MEKAGLRYATPLAAAEDARWGRSATPSAQEIEAAGADVHCKRETGLVAIWSAVDTEVQQGVIKAHAADFEAFGKTRQTYLAAARRVLDTES